MEIPFIPPWLSNNGGTNGPPSPSVTLTLSPSTATPAPRPQTDRDISDPALHRNAIPGYITVNSHTVAELVECCREMEEGHRAWLAQKKESAWRLKRIEQQLELDRDRKKKDKSNEIEAKVRALREELNATLERIELEYREQIAGLKMDAEAKEQKLAEQWAAKHMRLSKFLEQVGCRPWTPPEMNGR